MTKHASLNAEKISAYCTASARLLRIEVVAQTGSTNSDLMVRSATLSGPTVLIAVSQTAGRGRAGRSWLSAPGASLTFSYAWPLTTSPQALFGLSLVIGVALADALKALGVAVQLKWPNDVLKEGKKLAGVLIETSSHAGQTWAVIGVGLNLLLPEELEQKIDRPVADAAWLAQMDRNQLLAVLIDHMTACLQQFSNSGFTAFMASWDALHAYAGCEVRIIDRGQLIQEGVAMGVDEAGCLLLRDDHGVIWPIMAGDVSLRAVHCDERTLRADDAATC